MSAASRNQFATWHESDLWQRNQHPRPIARMRNSGRKTAEAVDEIKIHSICLATPCPHKKVSETSNENVKFDFPMMALFAVPKAVSFLFHTVFTIDDVAHFTVHEVVFANFGDFVISQSVENEKLSQESLRVDSSDACFGH